MSYSDWKHSLNYQTLWMSKDELVEVTYDAAHLLNSVKARYNLIDSDAAEEIARLVESARDTLQKIDDIMKHNDPERRTQQLRYLRSQIEEANQRLLCTKDELLRWPTH